MMRPHCGSKPHFLPLIFMALSLCGCSRAGEVPGGEALATDRWTPICIDRLQLSVPADVEISATKIAAEGAHHFTGIADIGANGIKYGGMNIYETRPATREQFKEVSQYVVSGITSKRKFDAMYAGTQDAIAHKRSRLKGASQPEALSIQKAIDEHNAEQIALRAQQARTGRAKTGSPDSFAVRDLDYFRSGFFDGRDGRVRVLDGPVAKAEATGVQHAADLLTNFQKRYRPKAPTELPTEAGFCSAHGFISESGIAPPNAKSDIMFRSTRFPGLVFRIKVEAATTDWPGDIRSVKGQAVDQADLHLVGAKDRYGPAPVEMAGSKGRVVGYTYGENCSRTSCRPPDQLYAFEAETYGEVGRIDRPHIILHMAALTSDEYKNRLPDVPGSSYKTVTRPGLVGKPLPSYEEGRRIFEVVLKSIRSR